MTLVAARASDRLARISIEELNELAELQTRTDRKYIIDEAMLEALLDEHHDDLAILDIDDRRMFSYESVYFDTPNLDLYRAAATRRRRRFKVRTRMYEDSGIAMLEVKTKDGRGRTVKSRMDYSGKSRTCLTPQGQRFIDEVVDQPGVASGLSPVVTTRYKRTTLVDLPSRTRATIDRDLVCTSSDGVSVSLDKLIVETKSEGIASPTDRWLWSRGARPVKISKCCTSLAAMYPDLPSNKWHRTLTRYF